MATTTIEIGSAAIGISGQTVYPMPIFADPIEFDLGFSAGLHVLPVVYRRENDVTFWAGASRVDGIINFELSPVGAIQSPTVFAEAIEFTQSLTGRALVGLVASGLIEFEFDLSADWYTVALQRNWIAWSKIGEASFVMDKTNEAGDRPMSWKGWAWVVKKLGKFVIVYGDNGICVMSPVTTPVVSWGFQDIGKIGIVSPWSVAGSESIHFFITSLGELWKFTSEGPEKLGFKEFLSPLTNPMLNFDEANNRLFISDGTTGYVYDEGLGGGYATITGITKDYVTSPSALSGIPISIMTDTVDLGHRGIKTVTFVEIGTDTPEDLFVAVDYRYTKDEAWRTSAWVKTNPEGVARITIAAVEFRVRVKQDTYDELRIDYINVRHQRSDIRFLRGPLSEQPDQGDF